MPPRVQVQIAIPWLAPASSACALVLGACRCRSDLQEQQAPGTGSRTCIIRGSSHPHPHFLVSAAESARAVGASQRPRSSLPWPTDPHPTPHFGTLHHGLAAWPRRGPRGATEPCGGAFFFFPFSFLAVPRLTGWCPLYRAQERA